MKAMVTRGPSRVNAPGRRQAKLSAPPLVEARHDRVLKAARRARRSGHAGDYHRLRIRAKRLRYSLEFVSDLYGARPAQVVRRLAKLQDTLGLLQDAEVATVRLLDLATAGDVALSPLTVFAMGGVAEWYRADADRLLERLPKLLKAVKGTEWNDLSSVMEEGREAAAAALPPPSRRRTAGVLTVVPEPGPEPEPASADATPAPAARPGTVGLVPGPEGRPGPDAAPVHPAARPAPAPTPAGGEHLVSVVTRPAPPDTADDEVPPGTTGREAHPSGHGTIDHTRHHHTP
jgi:hypothetical protein